VVELVDVTKVAERGGSEMGCSHAVQLVRANLDDSNPMKWQVFVPEEKEGQRGADLLRELAGSITPVERNNPLALGHIVNHPPRDTKPNVMPAPLDVPLTQEHAQGSDEEDDTFADVPTALGEWTKRTKWLGSARERRRPTGRSGYGDRPVEPQGSLGACQ
jgi:hypothetical protein